LAQADTFGGRGELPEKLRLKIAVAEQPHTSDAPATEAQSRVSNTFYSFSILFLLSAGAMIAFVDRTSISSVLAYKPFIHQFALSTVGRLDQFGVLLVICRYTDANGLDCRSLWR
jgi:hypothetical protein